MHVESMLKIFFCNRLRVHLFSYCYALDYCSLPRAQGNCTAREPKWYYDIPEKRCVPFYFSGCNGNNNNFISKEACEADCPPDIGESKNVEKMLN